MFDSTNTVAAGIFATVATDSGTFLGYQGNGSGTFDDLSSSVRDSNSGGSVTMTVSGFTPTSLHDVIVYAGLGNATSANVIAVNGGASQATTGVNQFADPLVEGGDYTIFSSVAADAFGNIVIVTTSGNNNYARFAGVQIQSVPEPSSAALLGLGGIALILRRRK